MELKERVQTFLDDTGVKTATFCKKIDISTTWFYSWMRGDCELSLHHQKKITAYLDTIYKK